MATTLAKGPWFSVPDDGPMKRCTSCGKGIYWVTTEKGSHMPVDVDVPGGVGPVLYGKQGRGISHFATCPNAAQHRKGKLHAETHCVGCTRPDGAIIIAWRDGHWATIEHGYFDETGRPLTQGDAETIERLTREVQAGETRTFVVKLNNDGRCGRCEAKFIREGGGARVVRV